MDNTKKELWLYTGNHLSTKQTLIKGFKVLTDDEESTKEERFYKLKKSYVVGGVYEVEVERKDDAVIIGEGSLVFVKLYKNKHLVNELKLRHRLFEEEQKTKRFEKKYKNKYELPNSFSSIAFEYGQLKTYTERRLFEQMIIEELQKKARGFGGKTF